jgi:hypothetical protein
VDRLDPLAFLARRHAAGAPDGAAGRGRLGTDRTRLAMAGGQPGQHRPGTGSGSRTGCRRAGLRRPDGALARRVRHPLLDRGQALRRRRVHDLPGARLACLSRRSLGGRAARCGARRPLVRRVSGPAGGAPRRRCGRADRPGRSCGRELPVGGPLPGLAGPQQQHLHRPHRPAGAGVAGGPSADRHRQGFPRHDGLLRQHAERHRLAVLRLRPAGCVARLGGRAGTEPAGSFVRRRRQRPGAAPAGDRIVRCRRPAVPARGAATPGASTSARCGRT